MSLKLRAEKWAADSKFHELKKKADGVNEVMWERVYIENRGPNTSQGGLQHLGV